MKISTKKLFQFIVAVFLSSMFSFTPSCYAFPSVGISSSWITTGMVAGGIGLGFASLMAVASGSKTTASTSPITPGVSGAPVILSSSNHNLLSVDGVIASGSIVVKNSSTLAQTYSISSDVSPIVVDPDSNKSTCLGIVAAGATCVFSISYAGTKGNPSRSSVSFKVKDVNGTVDAVFVNVIGIDPGAFYTPSIDATKAMGVVGTANTFATGNKSGVNFLYIGSSKGVFKSSDNGITWMKCLSGNVKVIYSMKSTSSIDVLYTGIISGANGKFLKSSDGGVTWESVGNGWPTDKYPRSLCSDGRILYASISTDGVYAIDTSVDSSIWKKVGDGLPTGKNFTSLRLINGILYLAASNSDSGGVFKVDATGGTWTSFNNGLTDKGVLSLCSINGILYAGTYSGVFKVDTNANVGAVWTRTNITKATNVLYSVGDVLYAGALNYGIFKSVNGMDWESAGLTGAGIGFLSSIKDDILSDVLYAGVMNGAVFKSNNYGKDWVSLASLGYVIVESWCSLRDTLYMGVFGNGGSGVFKSDDYGANWTAMINGLTELNAIALNTVGENLYVGSTRRGVFKSIDNGKNWIDFNAGLGMDYIYVYKLYSVQNSPILYAILGFNYQLPSIFKIDTSRSDANWERIGSDSLFSNNDIRGLCLIDGILYTGAVVDGAVGVYSINPNDMAADWQQVNGASWPADNLVYDLYAIDKILYVGTWVDVGSDKGGVYKIDTANISNTTWEKVAGDSWPKNSRSSALYSIGKVLYSSYNIDEADISAVGVCKIDTSKLDVGWTIIDQNSSIGVYEINSLYSLKDPSTGNNILYVGDIAVQELGN